MRQDGGDGDGDHRDGEGVDDGRVEREESPQQEKCVAIYEHPGGVRNAGKDSYNCDGIGESSGGKDGHGEMGHWGEGSSIVGEKMLGRENVRLKLALVECRLLLHDQVNLMGSNACQVNHKMFLKESQLSRERAVADARLATITAQLARLITMIMIIIVVSINFIIIIISPPSLVTLQGLSPSSISLSIAIIILIVDPHNID